jgi:oligogalacturonide lyase
MHRLSVWLILCAAALPAAGADEPPRSWIDADTGHRVVRLTNEPGSASLYFNQNGYTAAPTGSITWNFHPPTRRC